MNESERTVKEIIDREGLAGALELLEAIRDECSKSVSICDQEGATDYANVWGKLEQRIDVVVRYCQDAGRRIGELV
jgi:hypothetical protein